jgi:ribulose-phosphate 3-epimerase
VAAGHDVALVVSRADTRRGRGGASTPSAVKQSAIDAGLAVSDRLDDVTGAGVELAVVAAYGRIVPPRILDVVPMVNVHFSLLPRWRGAAPVERAILAGDEVTGVCLMWMEAGLDTGPVLARRQVVIGADEHAAALVGRLATAGAELLVESLAHGVGGPNAARPSMRPSSSRTSSAWTGDARRACCSGSYGSTGRGRPFAASACGSSARGPTMTAPPANRGRSPVTGCGAHPAAWSCSPCSRRLSAPWRSPTGGAVCARTRGRGSGKRSATIRLAAMLRIAPSVLSADFGGLAEAVGEVSSEADWLHVDVMDAHFVPNLTVGPPVVASLRRHSGLFFDCHLMMTDPGDYLEAFRAAGADGCTVHVEVGGTAALLTEAKALGLRAGLALNPETPYEAIDPFLEQADLILCMTVHPGFGGQEFMAEVLPKIARTRQELDRRGLGAELEVDGGIDEETAPLVVGAGARVLVAGSAVFGADRPWEAARRIRRAAEKALPGAPLDS